MFVAPSGRTNHRRRLGSPSSHLSTSFVTDVLLRRGLSTAFPRSSRAPGQEQEAEDPDQGPARSSARIFVTAASMPRIPRRPPGLRTQQNARRNLGSVASAACASTCDVAFSSAAPSGRNHCTVRAARWLPSCPRDSRFAAGFRGGCPRRFHGRCVAWVRHPPRGATTCRSPGWAAHSRSRRLDHRLPSPATATDRARSGAPRADRLLARRRSPRRPASPPGRSGPPVTTAARGCARSRSTSRHCHGASRHLRGGGSAARPRSRARGG